MHRATWNISIISVLWSGSKMIRKIEGAMPKLSYTQSPGFELRFVWLLSPEVFRYLRKTYWTGECSRSRGRKRKLRCLDVSDSSGECWDPQWPCSSFGVIAFEVCFKHLNLNDHNIYRRAHACRAFLPYLNPGFMSLESLLPTCMHTAKYLKFKYCLHECQWQLNESKTNICPAL